MSAEPIIQSNQSPDEWLEAQCRQIEAAGKELVAVAEEINYRVGRIADGEPVAGDQIVTEELTRRMETACEMLRNLKITIQEAVFDCEHEMRELREREVSPAELLIDGDRLIRQYRFLRRRGRIMDGLLAYLPIVTQSTRTICDQLYQLQEGAILEGPLIVPDCSFALVALEQLSDS